MAKSFTVSDGTGGGVLAITKRGNGTWLLNGPANHTGDTVINGGTLGLGAASTSLASANIQLVTYTLFGDGYLGIDTVGSGLQGPGLKQPPRPKPKPQGLVLLYRRSFSAGGRWRQRRPT